MGAYKREDHDLKRQRDFKERGRAYFQTIRIREEFKKCSQTFNTPLTEQEQEEVVYA